MLSYMQLLWHVNVRDLSIHRFWYPRGSWSQSSVDMEDDCTQNVLLCKDNRTKSYLEGGDIGIAFAVVLKET